MSEPAPLRCAIYTRKSSEEGLEQSFNSLAAQREFCEAYVRSQAGEGWRPSLERYDDGGFSGGDLKRPGLRRLLDDIAERKVDVVVVYKVDRLTRSLADFARLIESFEQANVSFVSVTQAFNTTTSMGRLTLNVLLSFAQYEREITGERIRDKIGASKRKGMWMGGIVPLGYDPPGQGQRKLIVNEHDAETVRLIFHRFLELGSVSRLQTWLRTEGVRSRGGVSRRGKLIPSAVFSSGALQHILKNRIYLGEIPHKGEVFPGLHAAIVDRAVFNAAQAVLQHNRDRRRLRVAKGDTMLLRGKLFDADGQAMTPVFAARRGRRYSYYVSPPGIGGDGDAIRRVPRSAAEDLIRNRVGRVLGQEQATDADIRAVVLRVEIHAGSVHLLIALKVLGHLTGSKLTLDEVRARAGVGDQVIRDGARAHCARIVVPLRLKPRGGRTWNESPEGAMLHELPAVLPAVVKRLRAAHELLRQNNLSPDQDAHQFREGRSPPASRQVKMVKWAFLAPDIQTAIMTGEMSLQSAERLIAASALPLSWRRQRLALGMAGYKPPDGGQRVDGQLVSDALNSVA